MDASSDEPKQLDTDVLVLGTGGAGLRAALEARQAGARVLVLSKMEREEHNCTIRTWGGFTYSTDALAEELFRQVVETGGYLNNQRLVEVFARETPERVGELAQLGVEMKVLGDAASAGTLGLTKLTAEGRASGLAMTRPLRAIAEEKGVEFLDKTMATALLRRNGTVIGATAVNLDTGAFLVISAKAVVLATGGGACLYERTDNPPGTTGDGIALAYRAGGELVDMECVSFQFPNERLRSLFELEEVPDEALLKVGAAHYFLGGVKINERCETTVEGLYAAGEVAGGLFGAARLGGSAMADLVVFGARAGREAARRALAMEPQPPDDTQVSTQHQRGKALLLDGDVQPETVTGRLPQLMWRSCGTMKTRASLERALQQLEELEPLRSRLHAAAPSQLREALEAGNMLDVARLIAFASLLREESRGCFWRIDFPDPANENWVKNIHLWHEGEALRHRIAQAVFTRLTQPTRPRIGAGCFDYLRH